jgi:thioredoxin reductase
VLGRSRRNVLVVDSGRYRNAASKEMHCFLGADGVNPADFKALARTQLQAYPSVTYLKAEATDITANGNRFTATLSTGTTATARTILMATGVVDEVPNVKGIQAFWGKTVHVCPYCDGWECRDTPITVYGKGEKGAGLALMLRQWSPTITLCTDGPAGFHPGTPEALAEHTIKVLETPISHLSGTGHQLETIHFTDGTTLATCSLFFNTGQHQRSPLFKQLGCDVDSKGGILCDENGLTSIRNVYVAGDASRDVQLAIVAAAEGAKAAVAINKALMVEDGLLK